jgi:uncharacterized protein YgbK (DUF1537 family)
VAAVSGSVSPNTAAQIAHAAAHGFEPIPFDATQAIATSGLRAEVERAIASSLAAIRNGRDPLVFTAAGPDDAAVAAFRAAVKTSGEPMATVNDRLGSALGDVLKALIREAGLRRVVISGGDTSGQAASQLGIDALTAIAPLAVGAPLCRAHSVDPAIDGLEISLKGGQAGGADFFVAARGR